MCCSVASPATVKVLTSSQLLENILPFAVTIHWLHNPFFTEPSSHCPIILWSLCLVHNGSPTHYFTFMPRASMQSTTRQFSLLCYTRFTTRSSFILTWPRHLSTLSPRVFSTTRICTTFLICPSTCAITSFSPEHFQKGFGIWLGCPVIISSKQLPLRFFIL